MNELNNFRTLACWEIRLLCSRAYYEQAGLIVLDLVASAAAVHWRAGFSAAVVDCCLSVQQAV